MGKVMIKCDFCGKEILRYPSQIKGKNFCSKSCMNKFASKKYNPKGYEYRDFSKNSKRFKMLNQILNPVRMTIKVRMKLRKAHLGSGEGKAYRKILGRPVHRVVAEYILGRKLLPGEVVHHIDENRQNNSPNNLMVFASQKEHAAYHAKLNKLFGVNLNEELR